MPVAQKSGKLLAHRIAARMNKTLGEQELLDRFSTDYRAIPTTVFSPTEYSFVGLSEEQAIQQYGEEGVEVYHRETTPLEYSIYSANDKVAYMKVITERGS